jgi:hypothetical protein
VFPVGGSAPVVLTDEGVAREGGRGDGGGFNVGGEASVDSGD